MIDLFATMQNFYGQFTEHVFLDALVDDPTGILLPRITYNFSSSNWGEPNMSTFNIWSRSLNNNELYTIAKRIEKALPAYGSTPIVVYSSGGYEFFNMQSQQWQEIALDEFQTWFKWHLDSGFPSDQFQWRAMESKKIGQVELSRATPFMQSRPSDERNILVMYGVINMRTFLL